MATRPIHPAAAVWPMLPDDDLAALAADIETNGLLDPITVDGQGRVVDGRNRLAACEMAGVEPRFQIIDDDVDAHSLIVSRNAARRHMTTGARAMAAALTLADGGFRKDGRWKRGTLFDTGNFSDTAAARAMHSAGAVLDDAPDLATAVVAGSVSLNEALTKAKQRRERKESHEVRLATLEADHPKLAAMVRNEELTLDGAIAEGRQLVSQWKLTVSGAEKDAKRILDELQSDISNIVIAVMAPRNTDAPWMASPNVDLTALIACLRKCADLLEEAK